MTLSKEEASTFYSLIAEIEDTIKEQQTELEEKQFTLNKINLRAKLLGEDDLDTYEKATRTKLNNEIGQLQEEIKKQQERLAKLNAQSP